ncbi:hypothetical protein KC960_03605 [Candidatus Saccharibacteria bacterium]|nr:hypothetical protein [Candidatus Saccharibacteria bacterium]
MKKALKLTSIFVSIGLLGLAFLAVLNIQNIADWFALKNYQPTSEIANLATESGMNDYGRRLFYVYKPALLDKAEFGKSCQVDEITIVLGCYISRKNIYLFDVKEPKLNGVEQVTSAHEMLHAAYDRLSPKDKDYVDSLLQDAYSRVTDERIIKNVESYRSRDPSVISNELHSILGTEVRTLPKELEEYYKRYFTNRQSVVSLAEAYASEFQTLIDKVSEYDDKLSQLNGQISRLEADLEIQSKYLESEKNRINNLQAEPSQYNSEVSAFNKKVNAYNSQIETVKNLINQYNTMVAERNAIAAQEVQLMQAIDTRITEL